MTTGTTETANQHGTSESGGNLDELYKAHQVHTLVHLIMTRLSGTAPGPAPWMTAANPAAWPAHAGPQYYGSAQGPTPNVSYWYP